MVDGGGEFGLGVGFVGGDGDWVELGGGFVVGSGGMGERGDSTDFWRPTIFWSP